MATTPKGKDTIFIVDDSPTITGLVSSMIRKTGCDVQAFSDGESCLRALEQSQPLMVLMDYRMSPMSGDRACGFIKARPKLANVPVVMMTAANSHDEVKQCAVGGADDFLPKPIRMAQLDAKIQRLRAGKIESIRRSSKKVLLVSCDREIDDDLGNTLQFSGFSVVHASTAGGAISALAEDSQGIDAVIVDMAAPWTASLRLLRLLQALQGKPGSRPKPVVTLCSEIMPTDVLGETMKLTGLTPRMRQVGEPRGFVGLVDQALRRVALDVQPDDRAPFYSIVEYRQGDAEWQCGYSTNLSKGGILVRTLTPQVPGTELELKVNFAPNQPLLCSGIVAWSNFFHPEAGTATVVGMGIKFTSFDTQCHSHAAEILKNFGQKLHHLQPV